jgi:5-methylcytosine-specific restriction enzyme A
MTHPFYLSKAWRRLRAARLRMDAHTCTVPGCKARAIIVDHIQPRLAGGSDAIWNLRSLCREHDNQIKERPGGKRANKGRLVVRGCNADGSPRDPTHPWYKAT